MCKGAIMLWKVLLGIAIANCGLAVSTPASALAYQDIQGSWCGLASNRNLTNVNFSPESFTITFLSNNSQVSLKIVRYEFTDSVVTIQYQNTSGATLQVHYGEFSLDDQRMAQEASTAGPRYLFVRC